MNSTEKNMSAVLDFIFGSTKFKKNCSNLDLYVPLLLMQFIYVKKKPQHIVWIEHV